jgi:hypothetical protein
MNVRIPEQFNHIADTAQHRLAVLAVAAAACGGVAGQVNVAQARGGYPVHGAAERAEAPSQTHTSIWNFLAAGSVLGISLGIPARAIYKAMDDTITER